ncbi:MAG: hypothetical protein WBD74_13155 [Candidatus Aquilonibacter sp.]
MIKTFLLAALLVAQVPQAASVASAPPPAPEVISSFTGRIAPVQHYTFDVDARIALLTFPWLRFTLHGHGTYTRGGDFSVHFNNVPWFGRGFDTMPMGALDLNNWPALYSMQVAQTDGSVTTLSMRDVKDSHLTQARAKIDATQGLLQVLWTYDYGGHVKLTIVPQPVAGYYFPSTEEAEIVMPQYRAMAWATFSNYQVATAHSAPETSARQRR